MSGPSRDKEERRWTDAACVPDRGAQEAVDRFLNDLQVYPGGYFSRFPQHGALSMDLRA